MAACVFRIPLLLIDLSNFEWSECKKAGLPRKKWQGDLSSFLLCFFPFHNVIALLITASDSFTGGPLMEIEADFWVYISSGNLLSVFFVP